MARKRVLTTFEAGKYCSVNPYTIRYWIVKGMLPAYTTPGGHRRIRREDMDNFLRAHQMPLPVDFSEGEKRLLLVTEKQELVMLLRRQVAAISGEIELRVARSGFAAAASLFTYSPQLVFWDEALAVPGAAEACRQMREYPELSHIKVVALLSEISVESVEEAQEAGIYECLVKPPERLEIRKLLKGLFPYATFQRKV